jgi:hypothetical protein
MIAGWHRKFKEQIQTNGTNCFLDGIFFSGVKQCFPTVLTASATFAAGRLFNGKPIFHCAPTKVSLDMAIIISLLPVDSKASEIPYAANPANSSCRSWPQQPVLRPSL